MIKSELVRKFQAYYLVSFAIQRPCEAEFVAIRVRDVKEPLTPFGVAGRSMWLVTSLGCGCMQGINVRMIENYSTPPRPLRIWGRCDEVEVTGSNSKTRKVRFITAMDNFKAQCPVKAHGTRHVVSRQGDGTDFIDHRVRQPG